MLKRRIAGAMATRSIAVHTGKGAVRYFKLILAGQEIGKVVATPQGPHVRRVPHTQIKIPVDIVRMDIDIAPAYQGLGYARQLLMAALEDTISPTKWVELIDNSQKGIGKRLYGGEKTRAHYDVQYDINDFLYTLSPNSLKDPQPVCYNPVERATKGRTHVVGIDVEHVLAYFEQNRQDTGLLDDQMAEGIVATTQDVLEEVADAPTKVLMAETQKTILLKLARLAEPSVRLILSSFAKTL